MRGVELAVNDVFPRATRRLMYTMILFMRKLCQRSKNMMKQLSNTSGMLMSSGLGISLTLKFVVITTQQTLLSLLMLTQNGNRDMPVLTLLKAVRTWIMKRVGSRFYKAVDMNHNDLTEYAHNILKIRGDESRLFHATSCGGGSGIPCKHGLRVIYNQRLDLANFVSPYFKGAAYKATYANHIHPVANPTHWLSFNVPHISPPTVKRSAGRPTKQRRRGPNQVRKGKRHNNNKCSIYKELGHNIKTCKNKSQAKTSSSAGQAEGRGKKRNASEPSTSHQAPYKGRKTSSSKKAA
ncbi:Bardet-Biedl syndrome 7 protein-like protein [Bienertia sinuspersici]